MSRPYKKPIGPIMDRLLTTRNVSIVNQWRWLQYQEKK